MAKLKSIFNIEGTLGEMTFYKGKHGAYLIKTKSSIPKARIDYDPAFARTRENCKEFGAVNKAGMLIRRGAFALLNSARDPDVTTRLVSVLAKVKNCDFQSQRGQRTVGNGLLAPEGRALLKGFDFNSKSPIGSVLLCPYALEEDSVFSLSGFVPATMLNYPESATHVAFQTGAFLVDFELGTSAAAYSTVAKFPLDRTAVDVSISIADLPTGNGIRFWMLLVEFFQEVNGELYPLHDQSFNALHLLSVEE